MKMRWGFALIAALVLIGPFFIHVYPRPSNPSFNYFLGNLGFIEETLTSIGLDLDEYPDGDFALEAVVDKLGLRDKYLSNFESDLERADLTVTPYIKFAFRDLSENPIRIWIDDESYRIYSAGHDGDSKTGGLDADDIWTGQPEKARDYIHRAYFDWWYENNRRNLWTHLFECIKNLRA